MFENAPAHAPVISMLAPFFAAFAACLFGLWKRELAQPIAVIGLSLALISSLTSLILVAVHGSFTYAMGGWSAPFGIVFHLDALSALVVVLIQFVAWTVAIHSGDWIKQDAGPHRHFYYTLFLLFVVGITGITQTADAFNLYVLIEVASLTSYALIGMGERRSVPAALNYLLLGSIGATLYLLGVGYLYIKTGTLNMHDIHAVLTARNLFDSPTIQVAAILLMVGLWLKMAFFPFHGWLPNAYTWSPFASASLMAPLMTKVMIYVMIRIMLTLFGMEAMLDMAWSLAVPYLAVAAILYGSFMALAQRNLRRIFTYLIVAEVGYMVGAAWLGNTRGLVGAYFHILSDSLMTLCLFLAAASLAFRHKIRFIEDFEGAFGKMPATMAVLTIGAISMIGIPPTCGFFSKWYLLGGGIDAGNWLYVAALIVSSFINAVIFFRIFEIACFGNRPKEGHAHPDDTPSDTTVVLREAPLLMTLPAVIAGISVFLLGIFNRAIVQMIQQTIETLSSGGMIG